MKRVYGKSGKRLFDYANQNMTIAKCFKLSPSHCVVKIHSFAFDINAIQVAIKAMTV